MQFVGFYNFGGGGTEELSGATSENIPVYTENVGTNANMFFSGQFANLSSQVIHISLAGFSSSQSFHKHDLRAYESIKVRMIPLKSVAIHIPTNTTVAVHGMGTLWQATDPDEYAVLASNAELVEGINNPTAIKNIFNKVTVASATTTTLWTSTTNTTQSVYKIHMATSGSQTVELFFTDSAGANIKYIGKYIWGASGGVYTVDFDIIGLDNPNGQNGLLKASTSSATSIDFYTIGSEKADGQ